jgi:uncharacterized protein (TIGR01370 family)
LAAAGLAVFLFLRGDLPKSNPLIGVQSWFILLEYDSGRTPILPGSLDAYDMAILDPDQSPDAGLFSPKTLRIAYVSLGEAEDYRSYWPRIQGALFLGPENPEWKGNYAVDVRNPVWRDLIIGQVIPEIVERGFHGIFLDTLDTASDLESQDPVRYGGSMNAMAGFVRDIHKAYPRLLLISNNGFSILSKIAPYLSGVLAESIHMEHAGGGYRRVSPPDRNFKTAILSDVSRAYHLPVFIVDYAAKNDSSGRAWCLESSRKRGWLPYLAEKNLSEIYDS